jgi:Transglycosylase SLT domain
MKAPALVVGVCVAVLHAAGSSQADAWEFDRQGKILRSPHKIAYARELDALPDTLVSKSSRSVNRAIYRPMAEGVAEVYAADPAVADAGLSEQEFIRVFVALIDQESRFNPRARSPKGAQGLGQLMPETAALLGVDDAYEPMANLHGAARYLTAQLAEFGRVDWALAAYNAGPHRVEQYQGIPPYRETRDYVAKITAAADVAGDAATATTAPRPEIGRARSTVLDPELVEPDFAESTPLDQPVQGTVLEWTR